MQCRSMIAHDSAAGTAILGNWSAMTAVLLIRVLHGLSYAQHVLFSSYSQQARLQRGNLLLKQGKLDEAESDFKKVVSVGEEGSV